MFSRTTKQDIEPQHLCLALEHLFALHKNDDHSVLPKKLTKHEGFTNMCQLLKHKGPQMLPNELICCLKVLIYFGLNSKSLTVQRILHLVKNQINDFMPNNLIFLSFLLKKMEPIPLTDALLIAIPTVFDLNLSQRIDHNNSVELTELLHFLSKTSVKISTRSMTNIFTALLLNGDTLSVEQAKSIVWSFTAMRGFDPAYEKLYTNCLNIINANIMDLSFTDVESTLQKIIVKYQEGETAIMNESFLESVVSFIIEKDVGFLRTCYILRKFNKIHFVSLRLLDYVDKTIVNNHTNLSDATIAALLTISGAFSNANYKTEHWELIKSVLHENPKIMGNDSKTEWVRFAVEMLSLDFHSNILLEKVFATKYLDNFLARNDNLIDYVQLLTLWQGVKLLIPDYDGPLPEQRFIDEAKIANFRRANDAFIRVLAEIFGGPEFIQSNVESSFGHCLDYVISFDTNEEPIAMTKRIRSLDELPQDKMKSIAIFFNSKACYNLNMPNKLRGIIDLRARTLNALGIRNLQISLVTWNNLREDEKLDFIEREIRFALK